MSYEKKSIHSQNELMSFVEDENSGSVEPESFWKVLIADDDEDVHILTRLVLRGCEFEGRGLNLISAYSGKETREIMEQNPDIALILLDVVMEDNDTGLMLIEYIREVLKNHLVRIILRTGQPGEAPEKEIIVKYDINDYKTKTELTSSKLFTAIIASLRSYRDLITIEKSRQGLQKIIDATAGLFQLQSLKKLATGILTQLTSILGLDESSLYIRATSLAAVRERGEFWVIAATGQYEQGIGMNVEQVVSGEIFGRMKEAVAEKKSIIFEDHYIGYFVSVDFSENLILLKKHRPLTTLDQELIKIFAGNVSLAFDNVFSNNYSLAARKEIIDRFSEWGEAISGMEMTNHVKRVGKISRLLASKLNLENIDLETVEIIGVVHDVGKLSLPRSILEKNGSLSAEEFDIVKSHSEVGARILEGSDNETLRLASEVIKQHHEKWNGKGYPAGLKGEKIHILSRIISVADVFDSMLHPRPYRKAFSAEETVEYLTDQRGKSFDPAVVDILLESIGEIRDILVEYP